MPEKMWEGVDCLKTNEGGLTFLMPHCQTFLINVIKRLFL